MIAVHYTVEGNNVTLIDEKGQADRGHCGIVCAAAGGDRDTDREADVADRMARERCAAQRAAEVSTAGNCLRWWTADLGDRGGRPAARALPLAEQPA